jgi:hypothetical protein
MFPSMAVRAVFVSQFLIIYPQNSQFMIKSEKNPAKHRKSKAN